MYEFIDRLVNIALPRIKDFQGLNIEGLDNFGNYSFGIKEHIIFPEINFDKVDRIRGMDITLVTDGNNKKSTFALLKAMNFPFNKKNKSQLNTFRMLFFFNIVYLYNSSLNRQNYRIPNIFL